MLFIHDDDNNTFCCFSALNTDIGVYRLVVVNALTAPLWHPIKVISTLMKLGHEPVPPHEFSYNFITGQYSWYYPRTFGYTYGIIRERGFFGLYRGFVPSVIRAMVQCAVYHRSLSLTRHAVEYLLPEGELEINVDDMSTNRNNIKHSAKAFLLLSVAGCLTEVITRPFTVITLRAIAQHVGQETRYSSVLQAVRQIYYEEGILGFYGGLVPAILQHVISNLIRQVVWLLMEETAVMLVPTIGLAPQMKSVLSVYISSVYGHPLLVVSTLMAVNGSGLAAVRTHYSGWRDCWNYLRVTGDLFRDIWYRRLLF